MKNPTTTPRKFAFVFVGISALSVCLLMGAIGCSRCFELEITTNQSTRTLLTVMEENIDKIVVGLNPPEAPLPTSKYGTKIQKQIEGNDLIFLITRKYRGDGDFLTWATHDRGERSISVHITSNTLHSTIEVNDCISKNATHFNLGRTFADELIPYIYAGYTGNVSIMHRNGMRYSEGMLSNGLRDGKWLWWWSNGRQMQSGTFVNGKLEGTRTIFPEDEHGAEYNYNYKDGIIIW